MDGLRKKTLASAVLLATSLAISMSSVEAALVGDTCITPYHREGSCLLLSQCPPIVFLVKLKAKPAWAVNYLKKCSCGTFVSREPVVCCPNKVETSRLRPLDRHQYRHLINKEGCGFSVSDRVWMEKEEAGPSEFPWLAVLLYNVRNQLVVKCGGSLITDKFVLTAASCIRDSLTSVRLGEHDLRTNPDCITYFNMQDCSDPYQTIEVESSYVPNQDSQWNEVKKNDIGLIELRRPATINEYVRTICLPVDDSNIDGIHMTLAGWCIAENKIKSPVLKRTSVSIVSLEDCTRAFGKTGVNVTWLVNQICAENERNPNQCNGDTGGPMMGFPFRSQSMTQYGVVMQVPEKCTVPGLPGVYTSVSKNIRWILDHIKP